MLTSLIVNLNQVEIMAPRHVNRRKHKRTPFRCKIKVWHQEVGEVVVETRNVSDGGVYLLMGSSVVETLSVGTVVKGQVLDMAEGGPVVTMEVVRTDVNGVGLRYILNTK